MCSIFSDSTHVKRATSTTFLLGKMNEKVLPKCHEISYIKDIKVEVSLSHAHRELYKVDLNIQTCCSADLASCLSAANAGLEGEKRNL